MRIPYAIISFIVVFGAVIIPRFSFAATPNDPLFSRQSYLQAIHAEEAWNSTTGSSDVIVAVIDSGVGVTHEDLRSNIWVNADEIPNNGIDDDRNGYVDDINGWDFITNTANPIPKFQGLEELRLRPLNAHHGTIIAGLIGASGNNGKGIAGVAWQVKIMPLRAFTSTGRGELQDLVRAIDYAVTKGASIINLSFDTRIRSTLLLQALRRAYEKGIVVVAAAGNDSEEGNGLDLDVQPLYPACAFGANGSHYVIAVAAVNEKGKKAPFSHLGKKCVDIAAPGVDLFSSVVYSPQFGFGELYANGWSGTSFATALVSGAAALLKSIDPTLSPDAVRLFLQEGAEDLRITDPIYGHGLGAGQLNLARSLALLLSPQDRTRILNRAATLQKKTTVSFALLFGNGSEATRIQIRNAAPRRVREWFPFGNSYRGNAHLLVRNIDTATEPEILVSAGKGGGPHVRIFDVIGSLKGQFFAYEPSYRGGVSIDVGDPNPDGKKDFVSFPESSHEGEMRVFSEAGVKQLTFFPFSEIWTGGGVVRIGDVDGDAVDDIVLVNGSGAVPEVRAYDVFGYQKFSFPSYTDDAGPVSLALADIDGDGIMEIVTGRGRGEPEVRVWKRNNLIANFLGYGKSFSYGVNVASGDIDSDGRDEILVSPRANGGPHVRIFSGEGLLLQQFFVREKTWRGGIEIAVIPPLE